MSQNVTKALTLVNVKSFSVSLGNQPSFDEAPNVGFTNPLCTCYGLCQRIDEDTIIVSPPMSWMLFGSR